MQIRAAVCGTGKTYSSTLFQVATTRRKIPPVHARIRQEWCVHRTDRLSFMCMHTQMHTHVHSPRCDLIAAVEAQQCRCHRFVQLNYDYAYTVYSKWNVFCHWSNPACSFSHMITCLLLAHVLGLGIRHRNTQYRSVLLLEVSALMLWEYLRSRSYLE